MRRVHAAQLTLALLLTACAASSPTTNSSSCLLLAKTNADRLATEGWRSVSYGGRTVNVRLLWGSEPAHAAAALLAALLRHVRLYRNVSLLRAPHAIAELAAHPSAKLSASGVYNDLVIGVSTAWELGSARPWMPGVGAAPGLAGPRLAEFGDSPVPVRCRLFAWLAPTARARPACGRQHVRWLFYANRTALEQCDFPDAAGHQSNVSAVEVLGFGECNTTLQRLQARAQAAAIPLLPRLVARAALVRALRTANHSILFLDYDMWNGAPDVSVVEPPPCESIDFDCKHELDSAISMRVADVDILQAYAPELFRFVHDFNPSPESLRLILERQADGVDIEEAVCEWALKNQSYVISVKDRTKYDVYKYFVAIYLCSGDNDIIKKYDQVMELVGTLIYGETSVIGCGILLPRYVVNCSDEYHMSNRLNDFTRTTGFYKLAGVVSMTVEGAMAASVEAANSHVPLMLADVVPDDDDPAAAGATWRVAGRPRHVALALQHFVLESGWTRVAVLSQSTKLADHYYAALKQKAGFSLRNFEIVSPFKEQQALAVLQDLQATNARIVFVNTDSQAALTMLAAAAAARMGYEDGFVWIVREWRQNNESKILNGTKHFTVSFWTRGVEDIPPAEGSHLLQKKLSKLWPNDPWPPRAVSLANALLTLSIGFKDFFRRYPHMRQDLHNSQIFRSLKESIIETPVTGVNQLLRYKERSLEETFVFVDLWCDGKFAQRLATWRVNVTSGAVRGKSQPRADFSRPAGLPREDGASRCIIRSGDAFDPTCHDAECAGALLLLVLAFAAVLLARRVILQRLTRLQQEQQIQVIARRRHVATVLAAYLVERDALELHEELGAGRFGSVRLARLCSPGRPPRYIAAKALRDNAAPTEESEFLREACTIASLDHAHIVRLVGVCIADGPPLVLMELAFFGDLLGYMRARRHLVEGTGLEAPSATGEAEHVSAEALTRLAREAAEALQYLGMRGVVHRDLRAANCLVDMRRSLKLADFGMARDTVAGADGAPEYACRRRGLFPVLWMAPESLAHGVFSAASDVWAFGVLVLELVTLGVRPYGSMSPLRVLEYVAAGGSPPLPLDATPQTRGLVRLCWARAAEQRPSAAEVAAYLSARPLALRPALLSERDEPADADSGFGESPSTELLPPDSPLHSLDQFEDFAITH